MHDAAKHPGLTEAQPNRHAAKRDQSPQEQQDWVHLELHLAFRDERLLIARFVISLLQDLHTSLFPSRSGSVGRDVDAVLVACCVTIGHAENRPMNASKVAHVLGMPRMTAARRLGELTEAGAITRRGRDYFVSEERMKQLSLMELRRIATRLRKAADALDGTQAR